MPTPRAASPPKAAPKAHAKALTAPQEAFCVRIVAGMTGADAYRGAYPTSRYRAKTIHEHASRLRAQANIAARIAELRAPIIAAAGITLEAHLQDLQKLRDNAVAPRVKKKNYSAAVAAEVARGKASGLYVEHHEHSGPGGLPLLPAAPAYDFSRWTDAELDAVDALFEKARTVEAPSLPHAPGS